MIRILDSFISDKIAAGEVIERPLSIVKELIENSIDAGASQIIVEIRNGGKSYIRITDNGCGIPADEVEIAFERHATGKIQNLEDLDHIETLGFRGEALASICAISRLTIYTRVPEANLGTKLEIQGGRVCGKEPAGINGGTTMVVEDVFYNTPARRKFMRSDAAEASAIIDFVQKMALYYSHISFQMRNNGKNVLSTSGSGDPLEAITRIYPGKDFAHLIEIKGKYVHGYISDPGTTRTNRNGQIFFVNGRYIRSDVIEKGLMDGYGDRIFSGHPVAVLFLTVPPESIDVNIHPNKKEIKFLEAKEIKADIAAAVQAVIGTEEAVPEAGLKAAASAEKTSDSDQEVVPAEAKSQQLGLRDFLKRKEHPGITLETERNSKSEENYSTAHIPATETVYDIGSTGTDRNMEDAETPEVQENPVEYGTSPASGASRISIQPPKHTPFDFDELQVKGYVFDAYIITQVGDHLFILDQHAAHERILYEKLIRQYNERSRLPQDILTPVLLNVSGEIYHGERKWMELLERTGYDIRDFGGNTFIIKGIPPYMTLTEAERFAKGIMEQQENEVHLHQNAPVVDKLIMHSCKAAVKANDVLSEREIKDLLDSLSKCVNPFSCPHGRPTFIRMSRYELERSFKRK